jgi:DegV family protein with EDD domain
MFPGKEIKVLDSQQISMGQGFMVLSAAEAAAAGASLAEAVAAAEETVSRVNVYALLSTLKYLALSGRVGKLVAGMADTLSIKPILSVKDGKLDLLERIRTKKKAQERLIELTCQSLAGKPIERLAIIHVNNLDAARELQDQLCSILPCPSEILTADFTPGLAVHAGSGVVGVAMVSGK